MTASALSKLYGSIVERRAALYRSGTLRSRALDRPTVSVGNLTFGGTGKTPVAGWIAEQLLIEGRKPAILSRGYGRRSRGAVLVSDGSGPRVTAEVGGDEPVALARRLPGAVVVAAERRVDAARIAASRGADVYILDDGYQHLAVRRDVNLLLLDARDPFAGGQLPPAGRLREPLSALERADAFLLTRADAGDAPASVRAALAKARPDAPIFTARIRAAAVCDEAGSPLPLERLGERRLLGVCGVASPRGFTRSLAELGLAAEEVLVFRDHHRYGRRDLARIRRAADRTGSSWVVTTEKDAVKLQGRLSLPVVAVRLDVDPEPGFLAFLSSKLPGADGAAREAR
jgi:tetraacyldisaccharide 4'-kinase